MKNLQATGNLYGKVITIKQVSKATAKKLFAQGKEVYLQSSNMYPFGVWQSVCPIQLDTERLNSDIQHNYFCINLYSEQVNNFTKANEEWSKDLIIDYTEKVNVHKAKVINEDTQFDSICTEYAWYNCDNERGKYIHFYTAI